MTLIFNLYVGKGSPSSQNVIKTYDKKVVSVFQDLQKLSITARRELRVLSI